MEFHLLLRPQSTIELSVISIIGIGFNGRKSDRGVDGCILSKTANT
jgi:hypothetical protein